MRLAYALLAPVLILPALAFAPTAAADCTSSGGTTICSQGEVRGADTGEGPSGSSGPYVPYPCSNDWYGCNNVWGIGFGIDLGRPGIGHRPGRG
ncbi:hypothetical protein JDV09_12895 [Mycobacterium sp. Y57]|nr:hypothetical protein [Mycolicibacterium xanthum]MBX7432996.1 hypothetical protein [Mycolicibacterium xanthum]